METIASKGYGCFSCPERLASSDFVPYAFIKAPGYPGVPSYEEFKSEGIYLERHCSSDTTEIDLGSSQLTGLEYYHHVLERKVLQSGAAELVSTPCHQKVRNCALCGGLGPAFECKMCLDGFARNKVTSREGVVTQCVFDFCPQGHRKVVNFNGIVFCEPCEISNCAECIIASERGITDRIARTNANNWTVVAGSDETEVIGSSFDVVRELCLKCEGARVLSAEKDRCIGLTQYLRETTAAGVAPKAAIKMTYVIEARLEPLSL